MQGKKKINRSGEWIGRDCCSCWMCGTAKALALLLLAIVVSGCASAITTVSPPYTKEVEEDTHVVEEVSGYDYDLQRLPPGYSYQLHRVPLCAEKASMKKISRKQPRGFVFALAEMPLYGLGLLDWMYAVRIAEASEEVLDTWQEPTNKLFPCGDREPAPGQTVVLQTPRQVQEPRVLVETEEKGELRLSSVLSEHFQFGLVNVFVLCDGDLKYLRSIYI